MFNNLHVLKAMRKTFVGEKGKMFCTDVSALRAGPLK